MSGLDPLAALAAQTAATQTQIQAIDFGVAVEILQQQLTVGDLLTATVLPPQGGVDLLSLFGTTVAAQLPSGVNPGQSLVLQVTGFDGNRILVQNLGIADPQNPPPAVDLVLPQTAAPVQQAVVTTILPAAAPPSAPPGSSAPAAPPVAAAPVSAPPGPPGASVAPPRAVFVAASVQPAPNLPASRGDAPPAQAAVPPAPGAPAPPEGSAPGGTPAAADIVAGQVAQLGLEARIAATRAASIDISELVRPSAPPPGGAAPPTAPPGTAARAPVPAAPPFVTARPQPPVPPPVPASHRPLVPPSPEAALLERLRIPVLPLTLAAAKAAANAGTVLPRALARLEAALAGVASQDGRAASLRTLLNFAGRLDPGNARALPEQVAAFVNNFVGGSEAKIAAAIRAFVESSAPTPAPENAAPAAAPPPGNAAPGAPAPNAPPAAAPPGPGAPAHAGTTAPPPDAPQQGAVAPAVAARVAERTLALQYDAKAAVAALIDTPPRGAAPELAAALNETLAAITGMQINVLDAQNANPNVIAIPLPVFYREQGAPVQLRVSRDGPGGGKLDADNFSIAFVLDTKTLGTVAIDVQTAGRAVSVNVKTEGAPAASRFRSTLDDLRGRLAQLRYDVANMTAAVAPHRIAPAQAPAPAAEAAPERAPSALDMRA
jgi:hypothetical protein